MYFVKKTSMKRDWCSKLIRSIYHHIFTHWDTDISFCSIPCGPGKTLSLSTMNQLQTAVLVGARVDVLYIVLKWYCSLYINIYIRFEAAFRIYTSTSVWVSLIDIPVIWRTTWCLINSNNYILSKNITFLCNVCIFVKLNFISVLKDRLSQILMSKPHGMSSLKSRFALVAIRVS